MCTSGCTLWGRVFCLWFVAALTSNWRQLCDDGVVKRNDWLTFINYAAPVNYISLIIALRMGIIRRFQGIINPAVEPQQVSHSQKPQGHLCPSNSLKHGISLQSDWLMSQEFAADFRMWLSQFLLSHDTRKTLILRKAGDSGSSGRRNRGSPEEIWTSSLTVGEGTRNTPEFRERVWLRCCTMSRRKDYSSRSWLCGLVWVGWKHLTDFKPLQDKKWNKEVWRKLWNVTSGNCDSAKVATAEPRGALVWSKAGSGSGMNWCFWKFLGIFWEFFSSRRNSTASARLFV